MKGTTRRGRSNAVGLLRLVLLVVVVQLFQANPPYDPRTNHHLAVVAVEVFDGTATDNSVLLEREQPEEDVGTITSSGTSSTQDDDNGGPVHEDIVPAHPPPTPAQPPMDHEENIHAPMLDPSDQDADDAVSSSEGGASSARMTPDSSGINMDEVLDPDRSNTMESSSSSSTAPDETVSAPTIPLERAPTSPVDMPSIADHGTILTDETTKDERLNNVSHAESVVDPMDDDDDLVVPEEEGHLNSNSSPAMRMDTVLDERSQKQARLELGAYDDEDYEFDDRTLLDVFAVAAKEWLTHKAIPETDLDCKWDWRSLKCEPSCRCSVQFRKGDYHLGRSCRRRRVEQLASVCEPSVFLVDQPVPRRILSLVRHTVDILKAKLQRIVGRSTIRRLTATVQENVCADLRILQNERPDGACWSAAPVLTLPERIFCREIQFPICQNDRNDAPSSSSSLQQDDARVLVDAPVGARIAVKTAVGGARQRERRRKNRIFADLYETENFGS